MLTLFGLLLTTGSRLMPSLQAQTILDTQEGLLIQSGCNTYIAGHDFKPLGEKIIGLGITRPEREELQRHIDNTKGLKPYQQ